MAVSQPAELSEARKEIKSLVDRARAAQQHIESYSQEQVDQLIRAMVWSVARPGVAEEIAKQAVEETALGNYEGKLTKMSKECRAALFDIIDEKSVGIIEELPERNIVKVARLTMNNMKKIHAIKTEISRFFIRLFFTAIEDG